MRTDIITRELSALITEERKEKINSILDKRTDSITIVLDRISHTHNISAVIRSADAFGISTIHIISDKEKLYSSDFSEGISLGSEKWIQLKYYTSYEDLIKHLRSKDYKLVALLPPEKSEKSIPVSTLPFDTSLALLFGNEVQGLSTELIASSDIHAYIPMYGFAESLNISVSCAITLYSSTISTAIPQKRGLALDTYLRNELYADWVRKSVNNVEVVERNLKQRLSPK